MNHDLKYIIEQKAVNKTKAFFKPYLNQSPKKQKKPQQVRVNFQLSCNGFYSFLIIGRAVTVHCFFTHLEVSQWLETKKQ